MAKHRYLNLIIALVLLPVAVVHHIKPTGQPEIDCPFHESALPETFQGAAATPVDYWASLQKDFLQSEDHIPWQMAGVTGLSPVPNWWDESDLTMAEFGYSVSTAGDVNGDGYDDVIVGAPHYYNSQMSEGAVAVYYGSVSGLSLAPDWGDESNLEGAHFGWSVGTAGDVNGDGFSDVIVGAPYYSNGQTEEGAVAVYYGSASGLSLIPNWVDESDDECIEFGYSVGTAGDVNGDGYDDVIVGARYYTYGQAQEGAAAVYHGSASGLSFDPDWGAESNVVGAGFGESVGTAGDVNGDGYADVIVGAPYYNHGEDGEGAVAVYHGSASGLSLTPNWGDESNLEYANFGESVGTAGDVNGDGFSDIIVGASWYTNGQDQEGAVVVYHGSAAGLALLPNWLDESDQADAHFGWSVGTAGDVNGDGFSDVIVGAYGYDHGQTDEGAAVVYHGSAAGLSLVPNWGDEVDQVDAHFGSSVGTAGDVNGDGYADVIVGAHDYDHGQNDEGAAFVYHGAADADIYNHIYLPLTWRNP